MHLALDIGEFDGAAAGDGLDIASDIGRGDAAGAGGEGGGTADAVDFEIARAGGGADIRVGRDDDGIVNGDVVEMLAGAIDANQVALLGDGRIGFDFMQEALAAFFGPGIDLDFTVNADFSGRAGGDVGVAAAAGEFQVNGPIDRRKSCRRCLRRWNESCIRRRAGQRQLQMPRILRALPARAIRAVVNWSFWWLAWLHAR